MLNKIKVKECSGLKENKKCKETVLEFTSMCAEHYLAANNYTPERLLVVYMDALLKELRGKKIK